MSPPPDLNHLVPYNQALLLPKTHTIPNPIYQIRYAACKRLTFGKDPTMFGISVRV
jgi:hypothetical protein